MELHRVEHQGEAEASVDAVVPAAVVVHEGVLDCGIAGYGASAGDAEAVANVWASVHHELEMRGVHVAVDHERQFHHAVAGLRVAVDAVGVVRLLVLREAVALVAVGQTYLIAEIGQEVEHLHVLDVGHGEVPGVVEPALAVTRRIGEEARHRGAEVDSNHGVVVHHALIADHDGSGVHLQPGGELLRRERKAETYGQQKSEQAFSHRQRVSEYRFPGRFRPKEALPGTCLP